MRYSTSASRTALVLLAVWACVAFAAATALSQTLTVIHTFSGGADGLDPTTGLSIDQKGNLYGTTAGYSGMGNVFQLKHSTGGWILNPLHNFSGSGDGRIPSSRPVFGPDGSLYGVTIEGGNPSCVVGDGCGVVYRLTPPATACKASVCPWVETVLYKFTGSPDGDGPSGDLTFDSAGNLYGTTQFGGTGSCTGINTTGCGTVFELTHSGGNWTESVLYSFTGQNFDGVQPVGGVAFDAVGNLFGTTFHGGLGNCGGGCGTLFILQPVNGVWVETPFYLFAGGSDGSLPQAGLLWTGGETFFGATATQGANNGGTAFEFTYSPFGLNYSVIYGFNAPNGGGPLQTLSVDAAGHLYGTTYNGGTSDNGTAFELTLNGQTWTETVLHNFTGGSDGANPDSNLVLDSSGALYGTATFGGLAGGCGGAGCGTVYQIK